MNNDQVKGNLRQVSSEIKRERRRIIDDDVTEAGGDMEKLIGEIQQRSGYCGEASWGVLKARGMN